MRKPATCVAVAFAVLLAGCGQATTTPAATVGARRSPPAASARAAPTAAPTATASPTESPEPASEYAIPGAIEEELPAEDLTQDEITELFLGGSGLGIPVDQFVSAWNSDDELQVELRIENLQLEPVGAAGMAVTQHFFSDTVGLLLLTDADETLHSAVLIGQRGATGDIVDDGLADLQHSFAESYFVSAVNPRLDEFESNNLVADMMDLDEILAGGLDGLSDFYTSPHREMIIVKGVRYDMARDGEGVLYLIATGE